jgi:hypothetical protein
MATQLSPLGPSSIGDGAEGSGRCHPEPKKAPERLLQFESRFVSEGLICLGPMLNLDPTLLSHGWRREV